MAPCLCKVRISLLVARNSTVVVKKPGFSVKDYMFNALDSSRILLNVLRAELTAVHATLKFEPKKKLKILGKMCMTHQTVDFCVRNFTKFSFGLYANRR
jgi:hypothetical protein